MIDNAFAFCPVRLFCCGPNASLCETFFPSPSWSVYRAPKSKEEVHLKKCTNHHSNVYISPALKQFMPKKIIMGLRFLHVNPMIGPSDDGDGDDDEDDGEDDDEDDDDGDGCKDGVLACTAPIGVTSQPDYRDTAQA